MRLAIEIPAAGVTQSFPMTGITALIEFTPVYETPDDVPLIGFDSGNNQFPIYPRARYEFDQGKFNKVTVTGTAESAGDTVHLLTVHECLGTHIPPEFISQYKAIAGNTIEKSFVGVADVVQELTALELIDDNGNLPRSIYVAAAGGNINYMWNDGTGTDPAPGDDNFVLVDGAVPLEIEGEDFFLDKFKFVNAVAAAEPVLLVQPRY